MKVVVLSMDDRPPNYQFLERLGEIASVELILPPRAFLGHYMTPGNYNLLSEWLLDTDGDVYLISTDMLSYGGLISSREKGLSTQEALERLSLIRKLKEKAPNSRIYLSSIVRRASISVFSAGSRQLWEDMNEYFKSIANNDTENADIVKNRIPEGFLEQYYELRNRNHIINKACIDLVNDGIAETLALTQEDTFTGGPQTKELEILEKIIKEKHLNNKIFVHNGADEALQELLMRSLEVKQEIEVLYDTPNTASKVMDFEDRPFEKNVDSHLKLTLFDKSTETKKALLIAGSEKKASLETLEKLSKKGKEIYILDVFRANGSKKEFANPAFAMNASNIYGYSSWNTASNSMGTILAVAALRPEKTDQYINRFKFMLERFVDDHLYQGVYRDLLEEEIAKAGGDEYNVSRTPEIYNEFKRNLFFPAITNNLEKNFIGKSFDLGDGKQRILNDVEIKKFVLPWDRTFECELELAVFF